MLLSVLVAGIAVFIGIIFFHAGYSKFRHPADYVDIMAAYLGRPVMIGAVTATGIVEMAMAALVVVPNTRSIGALACSVLLISYGLFMWRQIQAGRRDLRCGCSGPAAETRIGPELVVRNLLLAFPLLGLAFLNPEIMSWAAVFLGLAFGLFLLMIYLSSDQVIANRQRLPGWSA